MDLAKIRKKSLHAAGVSNVERILTPPVSPVQLQSMLVPVALNPVYDEVEQIQNKPLSAPIAAATADLAEIIPERTTTVTRSPLEAILAGRTAAGCDNESIPEEDATKEIAVESRLEYLCFRVSDEIYGINIMDIKEIIKQREVTEVPRAQLFVLGVLSLRGTIIPIIDMRIRLGLAREKPIGKERVIVIKYNNSFIGLLVDEVIKVVKIPLESIEPAPTVLDGIDRDFISGIGRSDGRLIIILNLENISDINLY
jgi:purine-binding chemotaxis protein CheW